MENLNKQPNSGGDNTYADLMSDVPAFDPEAAKRRYERDHPSAVRDIEKARAMATAGDKARMVEAKYDKLATESIHKREDADTFMEKVRIWMKAGRTADFREEFAGKQYEIEQSTKEKQFEQPKNPANKESGEEINEEELKKAS